jgi:hypothetical protein
MEDFGFKATLDKVSTLNLEMHEEDVHVKPRGMTSETTTPMVTTMAPRISQICRQSTRVTSQSTITNI